jgi:hypothetical protein
MSIKEKEVEAVSETKAESEVKSELELVLEKIEQLTLEDLLTVQEHLTTQLRQKALLLSSKNADLAKKQAPSEQVAVTQTEGQAEDEEPDIIYPFPGSDIYSYTAKGARKVVESMFSAEELKRFAEIDLTKLPKDDKTVTEYVSEGREERLA